MLYIVICVTIVCLDTQVEAYSLELPSALITVADVQ